MNAINISTFQAIHRWRPAAWLRVYGPDAATFLQGQFSNDLQALALRPAVYGLWLTVKGKVLADSFVLRAGRDGEFWVGSYFSPASVIRERLESHIIADDVMIEDVTAEWSAVSILPQDGGDALAAIGAAGLDKRCAFPGRRSRSPTAEWVFPTPTAGDVHAALTGVPELTTDDMERLRITAGLPRIPDDVGPSDLPNEAALENDAISYTKGCYLGQEVMARLKSMGQVRRRLLPVRGTGDVPRGPAPLFAGPRQVGDVRTAVRAEKREWIGLAMLSLLHAGPGAGLGWAPDAEPVVRVVGFP